MATASRLIHSRIFLAVVAVVVAAAPALAQPDAPDTLDPALKTRVRQFTGRSRVIVEYRGVPDVRAVTGVRGRAGRRLAGGRLQIADIDNMRLAALAADPRVARVSLDRETFSTIERTAAAVGAQMSPSTGYAVTGRKIGIAIIDSGITALHDDLLLDADGRPSRAVVHFKDFTRDGIPNVWTGELPVDDFGHGTHVAGIIRGSGYDSNGKRSGLAPNSRLIGLKVLDANGHGYISDVIEALDYAVAVRNLFDIRVINLSVGAGIVESYRLDPLAQAAKRAVDAGIVVVAAAGNMGSTSDGETQYGGITAPGNAPWVLTVGASSHQGTTRRSDDIIAAFSSRGPTWIDFAAKPDVIAPGVGIESLADPHSTLYQLLPDFRLDGTRPTPFQPYLSLSGTSMAAPVVAGAVALMLEVNPALTPNAVKAILQYTAQKRAGQPVLAQGAGLLNVRGALRMAAFFRKPVGHVGRHGDTIAAEWVPWSEQMVWGNYRVTGGVPLPHSSAWALDVTWGALTTPTGSPVVWGARDAENIVWSTAGTDNIVWSTGTAENIVWSTADADNIVWSTGTAENIVWSTADTDNIVWSTGAGENIVWSTADTDNIVWSTAYVRNVVWGGDCGGRNCRRTIWGATSPRGTTWGTASATDHMVWSTAAADAENIVWSTADTDNIVWSTGSGADNIVWSTADQDNIVWSTAIPGPVLWPSPSAAAHKPRHAAVK